MGIKQGNPYEQNIAKKCDVCRSAVYVDQYGNGKCTHSGWEQSEDGIHNCHLVRYPNRVSFSKAKQLYRDGKVIKPDFDDFIETLEVYRHNEFYHNNKKYGITWSRHIAFYEWNVVESTQEYSSLEEFRDNAHISGRLLKEIWNEVVDADYMVG